MVLFAAAVSVVAFDAAAVAAAVAAVVYAAVELPVYVEAAVAVVLFVETVTVHFALFDSLTYFVNAIMTAVILNIYVCVYRVGLVSSSGDGCSTIKNREMAVYVIF